MTVAFLVVNLYICTIYLLNVFIIIYLMKVNGKIYLFLYLKYKKY